ncbi:MAG: hypothetical protein PHO29_00500 [Acetobacterium sp.]|nr:hypothetical protein [Acetobacterium sp.]
MKPDLNQHHQYIVDYTTKDGAYKWRTFYLPKCQKPQPKDVVLNLTAVINAIGGKVISIAEMTKYHYSDLHNIPMVGQAKYTECIKMLFTN